MISAFKYFYSIAQREQDTCLKQMQCQRDISFRAHWSLLLWIMSMETLFHVLCIGAIPVKYQVCTQALMVTAPLLVV